MNEDWAEVRWLHQSEQMSIKAIVRRTGLAGNTALAAETPPRYQRGPAGSRVDGFEPAIRALLAEFPLMPATVIAERIGWEYSSSVLRAKGTVRWVKGLLRLPGRRPIFSVLRHSRSHRFLSPEGQASCPEERGPMTYEGLGHATAQRVLEEHTLGRDGVVAYWPTRV